MLTVVGLLPHDVALDLLHLGYGSRPRGQIPGMGRLEFGRRQPRDLHGVASGQRISSARAPDRLRRPSAHRWCPRNLGATPRGRVPWLPTTADGSSAWPPICGGGSLDRRRLPRARTQSRSARFRAAMRPSEAAVPAHCACESSPKARPPSLVNDGGACVPMLGLRLLRRPIPHRNLRGRETSRTKEIRL